MQWHKYFRGVFTIKGRGVTLFVRYNMSMTRLYALIISLVAAAATAMALPADHFAPHSVLAEGRWVKIAVRQSGLYCITPAQLRAWGFSDINAVRVHGYGGRRVPDALTAANTIDDVPMVQTRTTARGIVFYAAGPDELTEQGDYFTVSSSPYTTAGYYFVTENGAPARDIPQSGVAEARDPESSFTEVLHHEVDRVSPGEAGAMLLGEDFRLTPSQTFTFDAPGRIEDADLWLQCAFVAKTPSATSSIEFTVNDGETLPAVATDRIAKMSSSEYVLAMMTTTSHTFATPAAERLKVRISHVSPSSPVYDAWLDYLTVCYPRRLELPATGALEFRSRKSGLRLALGGAADVEIWDVTDPLNITAMRTAADAGAAVWTADYHGLRHYAAHSASATLPSPEFVQTVECSDLHALPGGTDMVIIAPAAYLQAAERLADLHRAEPDTLQVAVVDAEQVYNEFGSGAPDVSAVRKLLKMLYDRGTAAGRPLRYALLMGRPTIDHRRLTTDMQKASWPTLPAWITRSVGDGLSDNTGYTTDDFIAMLDDGSGTNMGIDRLCVSVGRIAPTSAEEASGHVDKIEQYIKKSNRTPWKNVIVALADNGDQNTHVLQTEELLNNVLDDPGQQHIVDKIYVDAYPIVGDECVRGREEMYRRLNDGATWWTFIGHATNHSWTAENMLTYTDVNSLYLRNVPFIYAATCNFLRWDSSTPSGAEIMHAERNGGCIGIISAARPVYISDNGKFSAAIGRALASRDADGMYMRVGDIYRHAKNDIRDERGNITNNPNRLRFVLAGDPALRPATPSNIIRIDSIDGHPFRPDDQPTLAALQQATVSGHIESPSGMLLADFNGTAIIELYDAEQSRTTLAQDSQDDEMTFEIHGRKLLSVSAPVSGGRFNARVAMPADISDNFRPATLNAYAYAAVGTAEAIGVNRDLYVYGIDETAPADTRAPVIDSYAINHSNFRSGDAVSTHSPMVLASITDDIGINLSAAGIGHQITLTLDSTTTFSDVAMFYTPHPDGTPGGSIAYPMNDIEEGLHSLRLRVWDTSGNLAEQTIEFFARPDLAPQIFDLYTDANPAHTAANFFITHDAPDAMATVTVTVYNMLGSPVWTRTVRGRSDMFTSTPVTWDLRDGTGRRVARGIYVYSATITIDGETHRSSSRKLAVAAY